MCVCLPARIIEKCDARNDGDEVVQLSGKAKCLVACVSLRFNPQDQKEDTATNNNNVVVHISLYQHPRDGGRKRRKRRKRVQGYQTDEVGGRLGKHEIVSQTKNQTNEKT